MQLKHKGKQVQVFLHKPELARLANALDLLEDIAVLPCEQQELARSTAEALVALAKSMTKGDPRFAEAQTELPFKEGAEATETAAME